MNNDRRQKLKKAIIELETARRILDEVSRDEEYAFDNLPENFQEAERGERMQEVADTLYELRDYVDEVINGINEVL